MVYCYCPSSLVCRSVGLSVTLVSPAKTAESIEMPFGLWARIGPMNRVLDGPPQSHNFLGAGYIFATASIDNQKKNLLNSNISSTCSHNMNFGPLTAEIGSGVWGTPANFNGFRVLTSLLHRRRLTEVSQTLHDVSPSPGLVHYIHVRGSCPLTEFYQVQNSLYVQVLRSPILAALLHGTRVVGVSQTLWR